jgi:hypothetical protein
MKIHWNKDELKKQYLRVLESAKSEFSDEELEHPYLDKLSHQTKSQRIMRMIDLAYYLGWLRGIANVDEGYTPVKIDDLHNVYINSKS